MISGCLQTPHDTSDSRVMFGQLVFTLLAEAGLHLGLPAKCAATLNTCMLLIVTWPYALLGFLQPGNSGGGCGGRSRR